MEGNRHQVVGLLAGIPLFSGAWMTAFFNNPIWGFLGVLVALWGLFVANRVERRATNSVQLMRGAVAGALAAVVARVLGLISAALMGRLEPISWNSLNDMFRVVLGGDGVATLWLVLLMAVLGALIAVAEPDAKQPETVVTRVKGKKR